MRRIRLFVAAALAECASAAGHEASAAPSRILSCGGSVARIAELLKQSVAA